MTKRKWTSGPWTVEYKYGTTRLVADGEVTMCDETYYPWTPENNADWHLIAAAPDLYEALKFTMKTLDRVTDDKSLLSNLTMEDAMFVDTALVNARSALAKARGET